jgi:hypothetical protein
VSVLLLGGGQPVGAIAGYGAGLQSERGAVRLLFNSDAQMCDARHVWPRSSIINYHDMQLAAAASGNAASSQDT